MFELYGAETCSSATQCHFTSMIIFLSVCCIGCSVSGLISVFLLLIGTQAITQLTIDNTVDVPQGVTMESGNQIKILKCLEDLTEDDFKRFKWYLGRENIPDSSLEAASREKTVTLMNNNFTDGLLEKAKQVFKNIYRPDLVEKLSDTSSGPQADSGQFSESVVQAPPPPQAPPTQSSPDQNTEDGMVPVPEPQLITHYQKMLQSYIQDSFMSAQQGWAQRKDGKPLNSIYTELYVTAGGDVQLNMQHEVRQIEMASRPTDTEESIQPSDIFKCPSGENRPIRTVLTNGIAGIGKTFLVHKFVLDWAKQMSNQDVHLVFPFTFRQLNSLKERFSLSELIHECIPETLSISLEALNHVFTHLQSSGNGNYDKSRFKLLFVFDGLDESRLQLNCSTSKKETGQCDVTESTSVDELVTNLISEKLLRSARIWITTRPAAANQIHGDFVDVVTEVRGFTDPQKEEYFRKRFTDEEQSNRIMSHIKTSQSLHIMCHIPVFCWITATVLEDLLETREEAELPKTLTEMYAEFLGFQMDQTEDKYGTEHSSNYIKSLAKLAYKQLEKGNLIFYEEDLKESDIDVSEASVCSGVFTEIFKEERGRKAKEKMFSFVHLSVQEFLAAVYVRLSLINQNKNVMLLPQLSLRNLKMFLTKSSLTIHKISINRALKSPHGHLDLFLRFLLGLSLPTNQKKLHKLLKKTQSSVKNNQKTVQYIRKKLSKDLSAERSINLFHCLNELNDGSLVKEIQQNLRSGHLSTQELSPAQWSALVFILLSSGEDLDEFDLKKYLASEEALRRLLPVLKASNKALLSSCELSEKSCKVLSSVLSSPSTSLTELDLTNNDLQDSGVRLLLAGLEGSHCRLEILRLSGCLVTETGCASLDSALTSNPSHLRELDLSYNHPGASGIKLLSVRLKDPHWRLETLRVENCGEQWLKPGLNFSELTIDTNTVNPNLQLSDNNRKVTRVKERQPYPDHPDRFAQCPQLLCSTGLAGRCYWEVEWSGGGEVAVSYREIGRRGNGDDCKFGENHQSWSLICSSDRYSVCHNKKDASVHSFSSSSSSSVSHRAAVFVDCPAGTLSFYRVTSDKRVHLHTFSTTFTGPLYPGFRVWSGSVLSLSPL
ncbi:NACHT, LRR and PYD domains-containing protein 3-like isoform X2 [Betta splendens]|uniref:NACHT, LRR and PYD domains-containing protein 3-like isoform X2 n=1 Tax=Betta splendens TaxID=158456 RepID=A0A9W2XY62_BETSP|nr:NACHT, LRR and PYD domains-containing protein 3-like isoform X2 [Betta splendens]